MKYFLFLVPVLLFGCGLSRAATTPIGTLVIQNSATSNSGSTIDLHLSAFVALPASVTVGGISLSGFLTSSSALNGTNITNGTISIGKLSFSLATVATSGAYGDLTGLPTLGSLAALSPTGTADGNHYLRGDNTWATINAGVTSVAGRTGAVTLSSADISGLDSTVKTAAASPLDAPGGLASNKYSLLLKLGPATRNQVFIGDSITSGSSGSILNGSTGFPAVCQLLGMGSGGALAYDLGFPGETTTQIESHWYGGNSYGTGVVTTTISTTLGSTAATIANATGVSNGWGIGAVGLAPNTKISALTGTSVTLSTAATATESGVTCSIAAISSDITAGGQYPGGAANGWSNFSWSAHMLSPAISGVPEDVFLLAGANDYYESLLTTTASTTLGSNSVTLTSATNVVVGAEIISTNLPANTFITALAGAVATVTNMATATASGTTCSITAVQSITCSTTSGSPNVTVTAGTYSGFVYGLVLTGAPFSSTSPPYIVSGQGTANLVMSANATATGSYTILVHVPTTSLTSWESSYAAEVTNAHGDGATVYAMNLIPAGSVAQGTPISNVFRGEYNAYITSNAAGADYVIPLDTALPAWSVLAPGNFYFESSLLHPNVAGDAVLGGFINDFYMQVSSNIQGLWNPFAPTQWNSHWLTNVPLLNSANTYTGGGTQNMGNAPLTNVSSVTMNTGSILTVGTLCTISPSGEGNWMWLKDGGAGFPPQFIVRDSGGTGVGSLFCANSADTHTGSAAGNFGLAFLNNKDLYGEKAGNSTLNSGTSTDLFKINHLDGSYTILNGGSFGTNATQTTVAGSTSGSAIFSEPQNGPSYKVVIVKLKALVGTASGTFPTAFTDTPSVIGTDDVSASVVTSKSATGFTVTGPATGSLEFIGY